MKLCYALSLQPPDKFLLPEVGTDDFGKNCVVIDLDETLVHSSFKVIYQTLKHTFEYKHSWLQTYRAPTSQPTRDNKD